jgi:hypothetical protein
MATAYKYVERKAEDNINWAEVGKNFSNMLQEEVRVREEKKKAIDNATREFQDIVNNVPQGENRELNEFALNYADKVQQQMLMQETLLKSGQLSPRDYTVMRQNLTDGTDVGFGLMQDYNDEYSKKMEMMNAELPVGEQLSAIDLEIMANVEGFANFNQAELEIDPRTGRVMMAKMVRNADGILVPDKNQLVSVSNLRNRMKTNITKYDVVGQAENWTNTLGKDVVSKVTSMGTTLSAGQIQKISDIRNRDGGIDEMSDAEKQALALELGVEVSDLQAFSTFQEAQAKWAEGQLAGGSFTGASVLMDFNKFTEDGKEYRTTFDKSEVLDENGKRKPGTEEIILLREENGRVVTDLTDVQLKNAERSLVTQSNIQLDVENTVDTKQMKKEARPPTADESKRGDRLKVQKNVMSNVAKLYYGDDAEVDEAIKYLKSINEDISDIERDSQGAIVRYNDGTTEYMDFFGKDGQQLGQQGWVEGSANFFLGKEDKIKDITDVSKKSGVDYTKEFNSTSRGFITTETEQKESIPETYKKVVAEATKDVKANDVFSSTNDEDVIPKVQALIAKVPGAATGLQVVNDSSFTNSFQIKDADGKVILTIEMEADNFDEAEAIDDIISAVSATATENSKLLATQGKRGTSKATPRTTLRTGNTNKPQGGNTGSGVNGANYN